MWLVRSKSQVLSTLKERRIHKGNPRDKDLGNLEESVQPPGAGDKSP